MWWVLEWIDAERQVVRGAVREQQHSTRPPLATRPSHHHLDQRHPRHLAGLEGGEVDVELVGVEADRHVELEARRDGWAPLPPRYTRGVLAKYARQVRSAAEGAVTY